MCLINVYVSPTIQSEYEVEAEVSALSASPMNAALFQPLFGCLLLCRGKQELRPCCQPIVLGSSLR